MNNNKLEVSEKFEPLFNLFDNEYYPDVDTVIITGGRYSLKSFTVSIFALTALYNYNWNVLYTRYTNLSIVDSVKPEVSDKIELLNLKDYVKDTKTHIEFNDNRISFKGIKTGSKGQTANLKSLSGFNLFVNDEAEELPDYKTFKKIFYSIRQTDKRNLSILILNPTTKDHWIFQEFYEKKGLEGGENCIVDNVMYIHSSYLDADFNLMPKNILSDYLRMKSENPEEYENIVLGGWITEPEGVLLPKSKLNFINIELIKDENVVYKFAIGDPADKGGDSYSMPFIDIMVINKELKCLVRNVVHSKDGIEVNTERILSRILENKTEKVFIESNGVGLAAILLLSKILPKWCSLKPFTSSINKEIRILSHYEFVQKYFLFDEKYKENPEYSAFLNDLVNYTKEGDNKNRKDAIDVLCSAAYFIKLKFRTLLY